MSLTRCGGLRWSDVKIGIFTPTRQKEVLVIQLLIIVKYLNQEVKMDQIIKVAWELNENTDNRYRLVYEIAELAKKLVDETQMKKVRDEFGFEEVVQESSYKKENPVEHAIMVKASESDNTELVG